MTAITGVLILLFLDTSPGEARWLTDEERIIALERVRGNKTGSEIWATNKDQIYEAFRVDLDRVGDS